MYNPQVTTFFLRSIIDEEFIAWLSNNFLSISPKKCNKKRAKSSDKPILLLISMNYEIQAKWRGSVQANNG